MKRKKRTFSPMPLLLVALCAAAGYGLGTYGAELITAEEGLGGLLLGLLFFVLALYLQLILHEAGHLLAGLLTGYGFVSFRVGPWMLVRNDAGYSLKKLSLAGTGGQCLLAPPEAGDACVLYNLGGCLMNLIVSLIGLMLTRLPGRAALFGVSLFALGLITALSNGVPARISGIANDGLNALSLKKDPAAREAFFAQLRINAAQMNGLRLRDMPEAWFDTPEGVDLTNPLVSAIAVIAANRLTDEERFTEARDAARRLLCPEVQVLGLYHNLLTLDLVCLDIILNGSAADASPLLEKPMKRFIKSMKAYPAVLRTQYGAALLRGDGAGAERYLAAFERAARRHPAAGEIESERMLMQRMEERLSAPGDFGL